MDLNLLWFGLLGVLLTGYAILDGFDLGVGMLHLNAKTDAERRIFMNSIGPLWDGNEVWLVTFGGALFAAFPHAYATAFSMFYLPFMVLLFALIFRAVSMEFRSKRVSVAWRRMWDVAFFAASTVATFLFGVAVGDSMVGLPIGADMEFQGGLLDLLQPYALLVGVLAVTTFLMHGSIYLYLKTEGELQARIHRWMWRTFWVFLVTYLITTVATLVTVPHATDNFTRYPWAAVVVVLNVLAIANIPRAIHHGSPFYAFLSSSATIAALTFLFGMALYPNLIFSSIDPESSLTIYNAASSQKTLSIMRNIAFIGMPFVLAYTAIIYWTFRGKVDLGKFSY
ncbi:MAG: cytochrome d ubiquinol oxidase subunit II [Candidatus Latescibacterota bacterium]|nr:MAG: cytochrome d ubiquinol oxidase subunit II [Candidatus Latescibacterota bacterium]